MEQAVVQELSSQCSRKRWVSTSSSCARHRRRTEHSGAPGLLVDLVWHTHQLFPQTYAEDCVQFGFVSSIVSRVLTTKTVTMARPTQLPTLVLSQHFVSTTNAETHYAHEFTRWSRLTLVF